MAKGKTPDFQAFDAVVIGGGLVGGTLACALGHAGFAVALVDRDDPRVGLEAGFDGRAFSIALSSQRLMAAVGLWPLLADRAAPIRDIRVSDGDSPFFLHYDSGVGGERPYGYMVEAPTLRRALHARLGALPSVRRFAPARIVDMVRGPGAVRATLADGTRLAAPLAVAADGRDSETRARAGIRVTSWKYDQMAIVCGVAHALDHEFIAHERFLPAGPFAILPLLDEPAPGRPRHRSSIVWTERADLAPALMALNDPEFAAELRRRFGDFLGDVVPLGRRWCHPLGLQFAETQIAHRLALAGDAAHGMHPIAGQGLNMGLRDVAALAEVLEDARRLGLDLGHEGTLARYARWRRFDNTLMLAMTDGLNRLFSNRIGPVALARDLGLAAVNRIAPLKRFFTAHAMGTVGELPRLMRGGTA